MNNNNFYKQKINCFLPHIRIGIQEKEKRVLITTRKIKSRWVTYNSDKIIELQVIKDVNAHKRTNTNIFYPINKTYSVVLDSNYTKNENAISIDQLFSILGISKLDDLFTDITPNGYEVIVYIRNPLLKILSGYIHALNQYTPNNQNLIHLKLDDALYLMNSRIHEITEMLESVYEDHLSLWNVVIKDILCGKSKIPAIIDIDEKNNERKEGDSYKNLYTYWLETQTEYVEKFFDLCSLFLNLEFGSYYYLLSNEPTKKKSQ